MGNNNLGIEFYNLRHTSLPTLPGNVRLLLKFYSLPFVNKLGWLKKTICKKLNIPLSTQMGQGFYCTSGKLNLGENVSFADTFILDYATVTIGKNVSFSYRNMIITSTHNLDDFSEVIAKPVVIGDYVWITTNVTILPGVTIGSNTVIGAGSVVTKDIPSGVFAVGNPCKVVKEIEFRKNG
ncbi:acyltransferase [Pedobacter duraquae]|uniref:Acetyltransferase n=1 Tax=Pedobacter duraquae TaxID=425511 RepID=A0A4V3C2N2_9SPHI|nr:acyltransferase [Pedobacter duraquae]TDO19019.1 transferase family hexapeptide repeat protein [Pedobacter duraquae]